MCPSMIISASAGMMTGWETAFVTASGRLANPPAMAISFACSGIREPIVAAVYCSADSKRARQFEGQAYEKLRDSYDYTEGATAFFEKRKPVYKGE